jgi:8-oxo-dGTP diphosphatase
MDGSGQSDDPQYERPSVTVDTVILTLREESLQVLLIERRHPPFQGMWAIPGGFVDIDEPLEVAARRELAEETGIDDPELYLEQLHTFGAPDRDPRARVITVAYLAIVCSDRLPVRAGSDAADAAWLPACEPPQLAFDHGAILACAVRRLHHLIEYSPAVFRLLPSIFTLTDLQDTFERVLGAPVDKRNFRRKVLSYGILEPTPDMRIGSHRPARLYRVRREAAEAMQPRRLFP